MANRETGAGERSRWAAVVEEVDGAFLARPLVDGAAPPRPLDAASQHTTSADSVVVVSTLGGGKVRIEHTLASGGTTLADVYRLAGRHDVNPLYPPEVHAEVDRLIADPGLEDPALENL